MSATRDASTPFFLRLRDDVAQRVRRGIGALPSIVLATIAATISWVLARAVFGAEDAFFAPIAAIITMGLAADQRLSRGFEIALGVPLGIAISDAIVLVIGVGWWQLALVTLLAMSSAALLRASPLMVNQAAVSSILVVTLHPLESGSFAFERAGDALIGSGVTLVLSYLLLPIDPLRLVMRRAEPLLTTLADVLDAIADAIARRDRSAAVAALERARALEGPSTELRSSVEVGRETVQAAPRRRGDRRAVDRFAAAAPQIDLAVRDTRVLARGMIRAIDLGDRVPAEVQEAIRDLALAARALRPWLWNADPAAVAESRRSAVRAARIATEALQHTGNLSVSVVIGQVRATAVDLLGASGLELVEARALVRGERQLGEEATD